MPRIRGKFVLWRDENVDELGTIGARCGLDVFFSSREEMLDTGKQVGCRTGVHGYYGNNLGDVYRYGDLEDNE